MTDGKGLEGSFTAPPLAPDEFPYVRLHVTPLDPELLKVVLPSALLPKARNLSYHTLETFPEKRYGYLELPSEEAQKLRRKLNGSVLKGVKFRIEPARPSRIPSPLGQAAMAEESPQNGTTDDKLRLSDKERKRRHDAVELRGITLENGRKVKRGWTSIDEPKEKKSKKDKEKVAKEKRKRGTKSKYTDHPECLVKTILPANAAPLADADHSTPTKKKKKIKSREVIIHEFEKTTKFPTFLKAAASTGQPAAPLEFVDDKGWVNQNGDVVEAVKTRPPPSAKVLLASRPNGHSQNAVPGEESPASLSDGQTDGSSEPESASSAGNSETAPEPSKADATPPTSPVKPNLPRPRSSGSARSLSIKIPPETPDEPKVHPLEALYKRPKQCNGEAPAEASDGKLFSFFADVGDEDAEEEADVDNREQSDLQVPLTPFTRRDLEMRGIRSAAPTPDTAHPNRKFTPWEGDIDDASGDDKEPITYEDGEESEVDDGQPALESARGLEKQDDEKPTSDFQKWFWEHRGDLNRSWKRRRKLAGKEKRYRENKARMARAI
ncbi:uncharacterized protein P884DRAFT_258284 [Thermothelomyces heterothallicus CBS 202.75]|uniref:uncharacterized protein n=1 Tax=Thermothelomyces heterothallicus CBS 202.75 TaxID=1149848 RepID=UPI0037448E80